MLRTLQFFVKRDSVLNNRPSEKYFYGLRYFEHTFTTTSLTRVLEQSIVPLSTPIFQVWGANTDVGKTLVSAGLIHQAAKEGYQVCYFMGGHGAQVL